MFCKNCGTTVRDGSEFCTSCGTKVAVTGVAEAVRTGAESKIFESDGLVVTTERFVNGSKVIRLEDIDGAALPFVDKGWTGMFTIGSIGLAMLVWGGPVWKVIGLLFLVGAYYFFKLTISCSLLLSMKSGEKLDIRVKTEEILTNLVAAINKGIGDQNRSSARALRDDLSSLPSA